MDEFKSSLPPKLPAYRNQMTEKQKADFVHYHGFARYTDLPFAPTPPAKETEGLRRSEMTHVDRAKFVQRYGEANFSKLPW